MRLVTGFAVADAHVLEEALEMLFGFAGVEQDAEIDRLFQFRRQLLQHRHAAADMKAADRDGDP